MKPFLSCLPEERVEQLATNLYQFVTDCVNNIDDGERVSKYTQSSMYRLYKAIGN